MQPNVLKGIKTTGTNKQKKADFLKITFGPFKRDTVVVMSESLPAYKQWARILYVRGSSYVRLYMRRSISVYNQHVLLSPRAVSTRSFI